MLRVLGWLLSHGADPPHLLYSETPLPGATRRRTTVRDGSPLRLIGSPLNREFFARSEDLGLADLLVTVVAVKNPTSNIVYDDHNHERFPPGDPSKRAFAYFVLTGGRFVYASLFRLLLLLLKLVLSMSSSKDFLALASLEVDLSSIEPGSTVTVKWRGKPVFIRRRTEEDIKLANSVDVGMWGLFAINRRILLG